MRTILTVILASEALAFGLLAGYLYAAIKIRRIIKREANRYLQGVYRGSGV